MAKGKKAAILTIPFGQQLRVYYSLLLIFIIRIFNIVAVVVRTWKPNRPNNHS